GSHPAPAARAVVPRLEQGIAGAALTLIVAAAAAVRRPDSLPLERILLLLAVPAQGPLLPRLLDPAPAALRGQGSVDALEDREHDLGVLRVNASRRGAPLFDEGDGVVGRAGPVRLRDGAQRLGVKQDAAPPSLPRMVAGVGLVADASIGCLTRPS